MAFSKSDKLSAPASITVLEETDRMPFGKWKGVILAKVPASYFHWLWINGKKEDKVCPVANYIRVNLHALSLEFPDGIWD